LVDDVRVGSGELAGRGLYAARDFAPGEVVVSYRLEPLDEQAYLALPSGEDLFVHSFGGRRYLYPAPARFANHSDDPSCIQDFDQCCNIALRPIASGEPVTIDATEETARELDTFLCAYQLALGKRSPELLARLVASEANSYMDRQATRGRDEVVAATLDSYIVSLKEIEWVLGTGRWEALGSAQGLTADGGCAHVTVLLKVIAGNWQMVYQHIG
jgi:hypothetical protein